MTTTAESLLTLARASTPKYEEVEIPDIGKVLIKRLNAGERDRFEAASAKCNDGRASRSLILRHFCFDVAQRAVMFEDEDLPILDMLDPNLIDPIVSKALAFNQYTEAERDELVKNSSGPVVSGSSL